MSQPTITITSLDMEARGVGRLENEEGTPGKVIFVEGALPGERVGYATFRRKAKWEAAKLTSLEHESVLRVMPKCPYFGTCGGCSMQHLDSTAQVAIKQRVLEDNLWHIGRSKPQMVLRPIYGPDWGYRYRARLSVRYVRKTKQVLVGFRERRSSDVTDMASCAVLPPQVSALLLPLRGLIAGLSIFDQVPQIELAVGQNQSGLVIVLVLRIMAPLMVIDEIRLRSFADLHQIEWWLQPKGPDTAYPFHPIESRLQYQLPEFGLRIRFRPTDFTQVNHQINQVLVRRALQLLQPTCTDRVADLFCGIGNFTLPLATCARQVVGIEGSEALVDRARANGLENGLAGKLTFHVRNLFEMTASDWIALGKFERILIDPPRDGAAAICQTLADLAEADRHFRPARIVYVSCNPATLARDAGILVHQAGYRLSKAGVVNMFPHTAHVESIAVFDLLPLS